MHRPDRFDDTRALVTEHHRRHGHRALALERVEIGATDPGRGDPNEHLTGSRALDLDVLDPAYAPGVSHHEPGGLTTRQVLSIVQSLPGPIVGADVVELNPERDHQEMTARVAAKLIKELVARLTESPPGG